MDVKKNSINQSPPSSLPTHTYNTQVRLTLPVPDPIRNFVRAHGPVLSPALGLPLLLPVNALNASISRPVMPYTRPPQITY